MFVGVVCDVLCGDVWFGFVCVVFACVCALLLKCVVCDCMRYVVWLVFVSCSMFACVQCVCVLFVI